MAATLMPWPRAKFFVPGTNLPLVGGKVYTYAAGTTTPLASYSDPDGEVAHQNTNPIILDANGEASIYLADASLYKIHATTAGDATLPGYPVDDVAGGGYYANVVNQALEALELRSRVRLTSATNYYVSTTGNDANNGSISSPWATLQHAYDWIVGNVDLAGYDATVNVADGTYSAGVAASIRAIGGMISFVGNIAAPANCIIALTTGVNFLSTGPAYNVAGFRMTNTLGSAHIATTNGGRIGITGNMSFGNCGAGSHLSAVGSGSIIGISASAYSINGAAQQHFFENTGGQIAAQAATTVTLTGTPLFAIAFAFASQAGVIYAVGMTFSGAATGQRYVAALNSVINTGGGGANFFPGNLAGATSTGGQYG
jgi:hypothetical protein